MSPAGAWEGTTSHVDVLLGLATRLDPMNGTSQWMHGGSRVVALESRAPEKRHTSSKSIGRQAQLCKTSTLEATLR